MKKALTILLILIALFGWLRISGEATCHCEGACCRAQALNAAAGEGHPGCPCGCSDRPDKQLNDSMPLYAAWTNALPTQKPRTQVPPCIGRNEVHVEYEVKIPTAPGISGTGPPGKGGALPSLYLGFHAPLRA